MRPVFFIIVPAFTFDGPVKGAIALANAIAQYFEIHFVSLKGGVEESYIVDPRVQVIELGSIKSWVLKRKAMLSLMSSDVDRNVVISYCFSADVFSLFLGKNSLLSSSVRANNLVNYRHTYGIPGIVLAYFHYFLLRFFDRVYSLDEVMAAQVDRLSRRQSVVVRNFIDESQAEDYRSGFSDTEAIQLVFVGSLTPRKQPLLLAKAVQKLVAQGLDVSCFFIGEGVLRAELEQFVAANRLGSQIKLLGFQREPLSLVARADVFVLPSLSEGSPRAALEALFLGVPCVLRNVDGNAYLVSSGVNGVLFQTDDQLLEAIKGAVVLVRKLRDLAGGGKKNNLLPDRNRQSLAALSIMRDVCNAVGFKFYS